MRHSSRLPPLRSASFSKMSGSIVSQQSSGRPLARRDGGRVETGVVDADNDVRPDMPSIAIALGRGSTKGVGDGLIRDFSGGA